MTSIRIHAVFVTGVALVLFWALSAIWMTNSVQENLDATLDQRLSMSARMVAGILKDTGIVGRAPREEWDGALKVGGGKGIACQIRTMRGEIVAETENGPFRNVEPLPLGLSTQIVDGQTWRAYTLQSGQYRITASDLVEERRHFVDAVLLSAGLPFLVAVIGGLLALWIGIGKGLGPLAALSKTLQKKNANDLAPIADQYASKELRPVIDSLNQMLGRVSSTLVQQRAFTDGAAHELRTPLTIIGTHLQVAKLSTGTALEVSLNNAEEGVRRLNHTLEQMMALARADSVTAEEECDSVSLVIEELVERLPTVSMRRLRIDFAEQDAGAKVPASLLHTAVRNLLDNAFRYSTGMVLLSVTFDNHTKLCRISVADSGPGLTEEQISVVSQRFWRGKTSTHTQDGSGLGLSIVSAIVGRYGGDLLLAGRSEGGLIAELVIPALIHEDA